VEGGFAGGNVIPATFQGTQDDTNWVAIQAQNLNDGAVATTAAVDGLFLVPVAGLSQLRCRVSAWAGGGTITVTGKGVLNAPGVTLADIDIDPHYTPPPEPEPEPEPEDDETVEEDAGPGDDAPPDAKGSGDDADAGGKPS